MLNELASLAKGLDKRGIRVVSRSGALKSTTKLPGFIFFVDEKLGICGVECIDAEAMANRWKVTETKFRSFPVMNLNESLCLVDAASLEQFSKDLLDSLSKNTCVDFVESCFSEFDIQLNVGGAHIKRVTDLGCSYPKELLTRFSGESAFFQLARSLGVWFGELSGKALQERGIVLVEQMADSVRTAFLNGRIPDESSVCAALFGRWNKKKKQFEVPKVQVGFSLRDRLDSTLADSYEEVNRAFLSGVGSDVTGICSLSGEDVPLIVDSFPEVTLKGVGQTRLFSLFDQIPAQFRYGKSGASTFPASEVEVKKCANALQTICAEEFKGKIWQTIPSATPKKSDLLIAWLAGGKSTNNPLQDQVACLCGALESVQAISLYKAQVEKLADMFSKPGESPLDGEQRILVLTQVDNARREVVANLSYQLDDVVAGISSWAKLAKQSIAFRIPIKFKGEDKPTNLAPYIPSPRSMMEVFRRLYLQSGKVESLHGILVQRVFDLFLKPATQNTVLEQELLERLLKSVQELLINIRGAQIVSTSLRQSKDKKIQRKAIEILKPFLTSARHDALISISFLEILMGRLDKDNRRYPMSAVFQLGKLLAKVDELHLAYSRLVRKDDIPNQLMGNSMVRIALDNPVKALDRLGEKMLMYQNWAKVYHAREGDRNKGSDEEKSSFVGMLISQIGRISRGIDVDELEQPVTPKTRATLLLGYLAWEKKNDGGAE